MGEESSTNEGRKWEEDIYWTHFKSLHFFLSLPHHFHHQIVIPKKFTNNLREKLAESVALKGPSGATWNVGLTASGDTLLLKHGWEDFVADHSLKEDDFLVFKYNGDSRFDVLIFDPLSCCEKESSYFVRKCAHIEPESGCRTKRNVTEVTDGSFFNDNVGSTPSRKLRKDSTTMPIIAEQSPQANRRISGAISNGKRGRSSTLGGCRSYFVSNRRPVTEEEMENTLQMALAASTENGLVVVMRPSHVYKGFFMGISSEWANAHLPHKSQDVILRVGQHTWTVKLYCRNEGGCGLMGGWKSFVAENFLEEFDACLFELDDDDKNDEIIMNVKIFRVVEEVVPSRLMTTSPPNSRMPSKHSRRR